jgi:hypothetical protein
MCFDIGSREDSLYLHKSSKMVWRLLANGGRKNLCSTFLSSQIARKFCFQRKQNIQTISLDKNDTMCTHLGADTIPPRCADGNLSWAVAGKLPPFIIKWEGESGMSNHEAQTGMVGVGVPFERVRRITGYLVGTLDRFNNSKRAEERDRLKHTILRGDGND